MDISRRKAIALATGAVVGAGLARTGLGLEASPGALVEPSDPLYRWMLVGWEDATRQLISGNYDDTDKEFEEACIKLIEVESNPITEEMLNKHIDSYYAGYLRRMVDVPITATDEDLWKALREEDDNGESEEEGREED